MSRNEILKVAGEFYKPETITEREIAFARHMMKYQKERCAKLCEEDDSTAGDWHWEAHVGGYFARKIREESES